MTWLRSCVLSVGATVLLASAYPAGAQASPRFVAETPVARVDYWQRRAADIDAQLSSPESLSSVRIVFIGDSITDFWHFDANPWFPGQYCGRAIWDESFGGAVPSQTAINLGVSGDRIEHVLHRLLPAADGGEGWLDRADLQPETIFLMLGINNSFDTESPATESIYHGVLAVVARIQERKPGAHIVIQSLLPTDSASKNQDLVQPVNDRLRAYVVATSGTSYLDLYPAFVDSTGVQRRDLFNDGLHPSREGYAVWRNQLVSYLQRQEDSAD